MINLIHMYPQDAKLQAPYQSYFALICSVQVSSTTITTHACMTVWLNFLAWWYCDECCFARSSASSCWSLLAFWRAIAGEKWNNHPFTLSYCSASSYILAQFPDNGASQCDSQFFSSNFSPPRSPSPPQSSDCSSSGSLNPPNKPKATSLCGSPVTFLPAFSVLLRQVAPSFTASGVKRASRHD